MSNRLAALSSVLPLALAGCSMLMPKDASHPAANPLTSGTPLVAEQRASLPGVSEAECTVWPFQDAVTVTATESEMCVTKVEHKAQSGMSGEPLANGSHGLSVITESMPRGTYVNAERTKASKVAVCGGRGVWKFEYRGCAANEGTLTAETPYLRVDGEQWTFDTPASAGDQATQSGE